MKHVLIFCWWTMGSALAIAVLSLSSALFGPVFDGGIHLWLFFLAFICFLVIQSALLRAALGRLNPDRPRENLLWVITMPALITISFIVFLVITATLYFQSHPD